MTPGHSSSAPPDAPPRREREFGTQKSSGEAASDTAPSSSVPPDTPTTSERGFRLAGIHGKFSSSATDDEEPDEDYSQPEAI
jgi:hypothetical protein